MQDVRPQSIDAYIAGFEGEIADRLFATRAAIAGAAPGATETISYGMPTFRLEGNLLHFAAAKRHLGFYPAPSGIMAFADELQPYRTSKGAIQFQHDERLPLDLIARITKFRVAENLAAAAVKKQK